MMYKSSIKILFVNERPFNPLLGGIERVTDILTKALISKGGYSVFYLCGKVEHEDGLNYDFPAQLYMLPEYGLFESEKNVCFYRELLDELKIDIVINQRGLNGGFNEILTLGNVKKISVLHSKPNSKIEHNICRMLLFSSEVKEQVKKYIKLCLYPLFYYRAIYKAKRYLRNVYGELVQASDAVVLLSENDKDEFLSNGIEMGEKKLCGIPNPNTFVLESSISVQQKEKIILYVGRLDPFEKNVLTLVKIWKKLYRKFADWKLVLVGDGPDRDRIVEYIERWGIKNVFLEGSKSNVVDYYRKASFICLTSFYEGWGMSLTEGMAYGCIPFTFNNYGAASDIIDDGINGCLIKAYNVNEYASRLSDLMSSEAKRERYSYAAIDKVKSFSIELVLPKWERLFRELIKDY